ncbi:MAG TPA: TM2 domain-containing protein, partial [Gemmata sp.]|nr:TM2 domain-containing protein [Gemmata sp.]
MSSIRLTCPACARMLEVDADSIGKEVECGACFEVFEAKSSEKSSGTSSSGNKTPASKSGDKPKSKSRKRRRDEYDDDDDYDDDVYDDDDDYDSRPARRGRRRRYRDQKSRLAYILLGVFLGTWGVHNFYAGRTGPGAAQLIITLISIPLMCVFFV